MRTGDRFARRDAAAAHDFRLTTPATRSTRSRCGSTTVDVTNFNGAVHEVGSAKLLAGGAVHTHHAGRATRRPPASPCRRSSQPGRTSTQVKRRSSTSPRHRGRRAPRPLRHHRRSARRRRIQALSGSLTLNQWEATFIITPKKSGEYTIRCTGAPSDTFGVGEDHDGGTILAGVLASIAGASPLIVGLSALTVTAWLRRKRSA